MPLSRRAFVADEELGKKDDDRRPVPGRVKAPSLPTWRFPRRRRLLLILIGVYLLYLFFKHMPTDLPPAIERYDPRFATGQSGWSTQSPGSAGRPPPRDKDAVSDAEKYYYNGPVRYPHLAQSLYRARQSLRHPEDNSGVLFAASDLQSVADLIPLACEMARQRINTVHFALMGRDEVSIEGIQRVNGISDENCPLYWHDYATWSTDIRMEVSVMAGLDYMRAFLNPKVVIAHDGSRDDSFFWKGVKQKTEQRGMSLIALSVRARDLMWISNLDSNSLKAWDKVHVEMLVHAPSESSGSLIRLLKSLEKADYLGSTPALTIELPPRTDPLLLDFLKSMHWPSRSSESIRLRRHVQPHRITPEESSVRTVESFYPRDPSMNHVLVLSPQTELSPSFFHYLKYTILKYRYSTHAVNESSQLLGISLELPSSKPTAESGPLIVPSSSSDIPFFRWQMPNSNAALYFGDKWAEFYSFLSNRLMARRSSDDVSRTKMISKKFPAFMENLLELIRARGYYMLYPSFPATQAFSLVTVHNDLYQPPEEFIFHDSQDSEQNDAALNDIEQKLTEDTVLELGSIERPLSQASTLTTLLHKLPQHLPDLSSLPLLSYNGEKLSNQEAEREAREYARTFSADIGGCRELPPKGEGEKGLWSVEDIFCLGD
ncbi:Uncharacterized protein T310_3718 [Rasamsonia emersonii CBS 393.64]|uniref:Glycosyltransferase 2 n=1 Tax=Rasamsonia emersonii (strain ATCC 16479 / CBS 393.64 / IMI 116815) TaxID=1408163 RepID=A0A0F4YVE0_RASE3|nr:Uncharacterized protein T310_3718 [Rasamsonia emersonii CBS 393.64]KKA22247.1 Uncharacterized protein T310_3718 [Rasamsonia emersonii CBS 393.64]